MIIDHKKNERAPIEETESSDSKPAASKRERPNDSFSPEDKPEDKEAEIVERKLDQQTLTNFIVTSIFENKEDFPPMSYDLLKARELMSIYRSEQTKGALKYFIEEYYYYTRASMAQTSAIVAEGAAVVGVTSYRAANIASTALRGADTALHNASRWAGDRIFSAAIYWGHRVSRSGGTRALSAYSNEVDQRDRERREKFTERFDHIWQDYEINKKLADRLLERSRGFYQNYRLDRRELYGTLGAKAIKNRQDWILNHDELIQIIDENKIDLAAKFKKRDELLRSYIRFLIESRSELDTDHFFSQLLGGVAIDHFSDFTMDQIEGLNWLFQGDQESGQLPLQHLIVRKMVADEIANERDDSRNDQLFDMLKIGMMIGQDLNHAFDIINAEQEKSLSVLPIDFALAFAAMETLISLVALTEEVENSSLQFSVLSCAFVQYHSELTSKFNQINNDYCKN